MTESDPTAVGPPTKRAERSSSARPAAPKRPEIFTGDGARPLSEHANLALDKGTIVERPKPHTVRRRKSRKARAAQMREAAKRGSASAARGRTPQIRRLMVQDDRLVDAKPSMPGLDPLAAAQEEARHAKEGNVKLGRAVEILREGLELLVVAEVDNKTGLPVDARTLRQLAAGTLDRYSQHVGQNWRSAKNKLTGATRAGDYSLPADLKED